MPTIIQTKKGLSLSVKEAELQCSLNLGDHHPQSLADQRFIALKLAKIYETGEEEINKNPWKAKKYLAQATESIPVKYGFWSSETGLGFFGLFNLTRIALSRTNRFMGLEFIGVRILSKLATRVLAMTGMLLLGRLAWDSYQICKEAYQAMPILPQDLTKFQKIANRLKSFWIGVSNAFQEDPSRKSRMRNDIFWGIVNTLSFIFLAPWVVLVNVVGFGLDVFNEIAKQVEITRTFDSLLLKTTEKYEEIFILERTQYKKLCELRNSHTLLEAQIARCKKAKVPISIHTIQEMELELHQIKTELDYQESLWKITHTNYHKLKHEVEVISNRRDEAYKQGKKNVMLVGLVFLGIGIAAIPGINLIVAATCIGLTLSVALYSAAKSLQNLIQTTYETANKKSQNKALSIGPEQPSESMRLCTTHVIKDQLSLTAPYQSKLTSLKENRENAIINATSQNKVNFLKKCLRIAKIPSCFSDALSHFTPLEVNKIRHLLKLENDEDWNAQIGFWLKEKITHDVMYPMSFKHALKDRLNEEQAFIKTLQPSRLNLFREQNDRSRRTSPFKHEDRRHQLKVV